LLDLAKDVEDLVCAGARGAVSRVLDPLRPADGLSRALPVLLLDGEVDVRVRVCLPALALDHPAGLATAAGVAAPRNGLAELTIGPLRVLLQVADRFQALLVAQLDPAQVEHGVLHR